MSFFIAEQVLKSENGKTRTTRYRPLCATGGECWAWIRDQVEVPMGGGLWHYAGGSVRPSKKKMQKEQNMLSERRTNNVKKKQGKEKGRYTHLNAEFSWSMQIENNK